MRKFLFIVLCSVLMGTVVTGLCYNTYRIGYRKGYTDCIEEYQADMDTLRALHGELVRLYDEVKEANK